MKLRLTTDRNWLNSRTEFDPVSTESDQHTHTHTRVTTNGLLGQLSSCIFTNNSTLRAIFAKKVSEDLPIVDSWRWTLYCYDLVCYRIWRITSIHNFLHNLFSFQNSNVLETLCKFIISITCLHLYLHNSWFLSLNYVGKQNLLFCLCWF